MIDLDTFLDASRATLIPSTLRSLNLLVKDNPSSVLLRFP